MNMFNDLMNQGKDQLASALLNGLLKKGTEFVQSKLKESTGIDIDFNNPTPEQTQAVVNNEKQILADLEMVKESNRHDEAEATMRLKEFEQESKNTNDARNAITASLASTSPHARAFGYLAVVMIPVMFIFFSALLTAMVLGKVEANPTTISTVEFLKYAITLIVGFFVGSSTGSKLKT